MKGNTEELTARQSLDIISDMIREAKGNIQRNNFFFLFWGWVVVVANVGMYTLTQLRIDRPYAVWAITIPAWIYTLYKVLGRKGTESVTTHFDRISGWLWISYGITIFCLVFFGYRINYQLNPVILTISAIPTIVSGVILNFRPLIIGGVIFWMGGATAFLLPTAVQPLVGALAITCGYLIPGYMLRNKRE